MKLKQTYIKLTTFVFLLIICTLNLRPVLANEPSSTAPLPPIFVDITDTTLTIDKDFMGNEGAHGGSDIAFEFTSAARNSIDFLEKTEDLNFVWLKLFSLTNILNKAKIYVTQQPLYVNNGIVRQKSVAISVPSEQSIYINEKDWKNISDLNIKNALALHELLVLVGLEKTGDYLYSEQYLQKIKKPCLTIECDSNISYSCDLVKKDEKNKTVATIKRKKVSVKILGLEYFKLEDTESKIKADIFIFNTSADKQIITGITKNDLQVSQSISSSNNKGDLPNTIYQSWTDHPNSISWIVNCIKN